MNLGLAGRGAAVAAASKGLGFACAKALAAEGARVAICGRSKERVEEAAGRIGPGAVPLVADVSTPEGARQFVVDARQALGGLDVLVTNAGGPPAGNFETTPLESYGPALALNLLSVVAMCQEAVPGMRAQQFGRIVAITSISVRQPIPNLILSNTARAGATGFLKTLAREVAGDGVTVNSVQPGSHATDRLLGLYPDREVATKGVPTGELGRPEDFGAVVAFLCSDSARFITGAAIPVDGGAYAALL
ncbi:MAG TPA: SDR family oxidoreductase [Acidimicrobiia bacterium]|jgi:3-oxoacyl-[acyl-carrier protein] reductase|nr:SDR family oxidoreductase [Acidimicrobiia bacterium]